MTATLFEKIYGCHAAVTISNSMGDVTEGHSRQEIIQRWGFVDTLLPQDKSHRVRPRAWGPPYVYPAHHRPPGMTEDGIERHRLMCTAIIEKGGRVDVWELARVWLRDIDPAKFGILLGAQDRTFYDLLAAGMPPTETGRYADWPGFIGTAKMMLPVGIVNACHPQEAARDALHLSQIKDVAHRPNNYAAEICAAIAAGCAEALRPWASVDDIIAVALNQLTPTPRAIVEEALGWADEVATALDLAPRFADRYRGQPFSNALEVFAAGLAIFKRVGGDTREAILVSINFGRDCDCASYVAAGFAAAMHGIASVPAEWVDIVERELVDDPYTVSRRSLLDTAEGLHQAAVANMRRVKSRLAELEPGME